MLFKRKMIPLLIGFVLLISGCASKYSKETSTVEGIANQMNDDLLLLEESIEKGALSFELLNDMSLSTDQVITIGEHYQKNLYGLYYNENPIHSSGILTGYKDIGFLLKKRLYKTEVLEGVLIDAYNNQALIDQAYYIENNGLLRIYPSLRVTDNISPRTNFFDIQVFDKMLEKTDEDLMWMTVPFLNPSGRNWVISLFKPIYNEEDFQGVLGYDIVASNFENHYLEKDMLLLNHKGDIISVDSSLNQLLNIKKRENDIYYEEEMLGKFPDKSYNLKNSKIEIIREMYFKITKGETGFIISLDHEYFVISKPIPTIDGYVVKIIEIK